MIRYFKSLEKFNSAEVTLQIGCSLSCKYCPQKLLISNYNKKARVKSMTFEDFKKYTESVRVGGGIVFSGMSEPFLNKECAKMICYAYEKGYKISLFTTLMGMTLEDLDMIKDIKFDYVTLHIPDKEGNSKFKLNDLYYAVLDEFSKKICIDNYSCHGTPHDSVIKYISSDSLSSSMMNRAGNLEYSDLKTYAPKGEIVCQIGTIKSPGCWCPEILPDGTVILCCMDYGMKHILGNLNNDSVKEILNSKEAQYVMEGMENEKCDTLCRTCGSAVEFNNLGASKVNKWLQNSVENDIIAEKIKNAKNICIFGLGKYFRDTYFPLKYNEVIKANLFSDNNFSENIDYIPEGEIIKPDELIKYEDLLVITYVKNPDGINSSLLKLGINNYINIFDIFKYCL